MLNRKSFFDMYRGSLDPDKRIDVKEVADIDLFLTLFERDFSTFSIKQWAYVFATVYHETGATFHPVRESPRASEEWRKSHFRYYPYYGRGYVQITWQKNYEAYSKKLNADFVNNPDLTMNPAYAWFILIDGFKNGVFTGKKMTDYINDSKTDYISARRIINGTDKAQTIAAYAKTFENILTKSIL